MSTTENPTPKERAQQRTQHFLENSDTLEGHFFTKRPEETPAIKALRSRILQIQWSGKDLWDLKLAKAQQAIDDAVKEKAELEATHQRVQLEIQDLEAAIEKLKANP